MQWYFQQTFKPKSIISLLFILHLPGKHQLTHQGARREVRNTLKHYLVPERLPESRRRTFIGNQWLFNNDKDSHDTTALHNINKSFAFNVSIKKPAKKLFTDGIFNNTSHGTHAYCVSGVNSGVESKNLYLKCWYYNLAVVSYDPVPQLRVSHRCK